jgi:Beta propeller domain
MTKQLAVLVVLSVCLCLGACAVGGGSKERHGLRPFAGDAEFVQVLAQLKGKGGQRGSTKSIPPLPSAAPPPPPLETAASAPANAVAMKPQSLDSVTVVSGASVSINSASITNVQTQNVDEGDIVKQHGDYLIVLRRGRLFTIRIGGDHLEAASAVNAYAPDADPTGTWYDEMLIADGRIVVIGYSYARGGTEIGLFDLDELGHLAYRATYQMRSNDYYSSRNYASRLIGHQLIFYSPLHISPYAADPFAGFPALRRWHTGAAPADFQRILPANRIYRSGSDVQSNEGVVLHSVSICDLDAPTMQCRSTAVLGPAGRVFYVSNDAVYVWTSSWINKAIGSSAVFRVPLDGGVPSGIRTSGSPIDQMSFLQRDGYLNVLLGREGNGEGMWAANGKPGEMALLRLRLADLGDGADIAPASDYRVLPASGFVQYGLQNRYIGDWLVYGSSQSTIAHALRYAAFDPVQDVQLAHPVARIDALAGDAILVGAQSRDLHFTSVSLQRDATAVSTYVQPNAAQGDQRTHGFFYKPEAQDKGIVGLPIVSNNGSDAAVLYLRNLALRLSRLGSLESHAKPGTYDGCKASCVDWYGNARPIFVGERIFALMGYELVEGDADADAISERRRVDFAPAASVSR